MEVLSSSLRTPDVLLIEDNEADADLVKEAIAEGPISIRLHVVRDGEEAMAFLKRAGYFADTPRPELIILDLNLPKKDGREVLREVKEDPKLCSIPIVVLTTSAAHEDIENAYRLHANCYLIKPVDFDSFMKIVSQLKEFWFSIVTLPK